MDQSPKPFECPTKCTHSLHGAVQIGLAMMWACMQFVQGTLHGFLVDAQIECAYGVPPLFDIAGSIQHTEVQAWHNSMQFVHSTLYAQIVCCDAMPPHFAIAGSNQH